MKNLIYIAVFIFSLSACKSKKTAIDSDTLPKDVALKPDRSKTDTSPESLAKEAEDLRIILVSIDSLADSKTCVNDDEWRITPIGSKPCGGPASYMAYHIEVENEIIPKIQEYTRRQASYNQKAGIFSNCMIEPQPSGMHCSGGKPVLEFNNRISTD